MRLLITEEALHSGWGHFLQYITDIASGCKRRGIDLRVLVHRDATDDVLSALPASAVHPISVWGTDINRSRNPVIRIGKVLRHNFRLARTILKHVRQNPEYDYIVAPTNLVDHVLGHYLVARWLRKSRAKTHYVLLFVDAVGSYDKDFRELRFPRQAGLLRFFMRLFQKLIEDGRVTFCTETEEMAKQYSQFCGLPFHVVPHVVTFPVAPLEEFRSSRNAVPYTTFGSFGFTRFDKGTDILQEAIRCLFQKWPEARARFLIQWDKDFELSDGTLAKLDPELQKDERVTYITHRFDQEEYLQLLSQTDVIALPYRKSFYVDRLSRVAIDSAIAGLPFIAPRETWLSRFMESHGAGFTFAPEDPESLADAIHRALAHVRASTEMARDRMAGTASAFGPDAFLQRICSFGDRSSDSRDLEQVRTAPEVALSTDSEHSLQKAKN